MIALLATVPNFPLSLSLSISQVTSFFLISYPIFGPFSGYKTFSWTFHLFSSSTHFSPFLHNCPSCNSSQVSLSLSSYISQKPYFFLFLPLSLVLSLVLRLFPELFTFIHLPHSFLPSLHNFPSSNSSQISSIFLPSFPLFTFSSINIFLSFLHLLPLNPFFPLYISYTWFPNFQLFHTIPSFYIFLNK